jgi:hypothetical protein
LTVIVYVEDQETPIVVKAGRKTTYGGGGTGTQYLEGTAVVAIEFEQLGMKRPH